MDKIGADFLIFSTYNPRTFTSKCTPNSIPIGAEDNFTGIIDLIKMKAEIYTNDLGTDIQETDIPEDLQDLAEEWREKLVGSSC